MYYQTGNPFTLVKYGIGGGMKLSFGGGGEEKGEIARGARANF